MNKFALSMERVAVLARNRTQEQKRLELAARTAAQSPEELKRIADWIYGRISGGDCVENILEILEWEGGDE